MKHVRIWVFYISLLGGFPLGYGQQEEIPVKPIDSLEVKEKVPLSLRFGLDLYRIIR